MSRIFMDGFESGDTGLWNTVSGASVNTLAGKDGNYCVSIPSTYTYMIKQISSTSELYVSLKYYCGDFTGKAIITFFEGAIVHCCLMHINGLLYAYLYDVPFGNSSIPKIIVSTWCQIEIYVKIANSDGRFTVKVNGIACIDYTGDTQNGGTGVIDSFKVGYQAHSALNGYAFCYMDNIIVDNANWIGSSSIQGLAVTGAGNSAQFDPSTGSNYACVDEIPPSDADYISTNVANEIDTYACGNLTGTINSVKAVQVQARCMQEGSPAVPKIQLVTRPTSTDRVSASKDVQTFSPGVASNIWELNPDDSAAWESADVNGMEIGVKAVAS